MDTRLFQASRGFLLEMCVFPPFYMCDANINSPVQDITLAGLFPLPYGSMLNMSGSEIVTDESWPNAAPARCDWS
jgi:hypothetical protein